MGFLSVIIATVVAFAAGALWYTVFSRPWLKAAGIACDEDGKPEGGGNPMLFLLGFFLQLVVAGMMRHVFVLAGIDTLAKGVVAGLGIGLFFITPWVALNNSSAGRPANLTLIDGGYATVACLLMGAVLTLF